MKARIRRGMQRAVEEVDWGVARVALALGAERPALLTFLFHALFRDPSEIAQDHVDPQQCFTVGRFREVVAYFAACGYRFVSPDEILAGLDPRGRYALLTFDDGYYNNRLALPVLEEFRAPAVFFISANHVLQQRCYWWDVVYRELKRRGATGAEIKRQQRSLAHGTHDEIEGQVRDLFGAASFDPLGEIDRPLTSDELTDFASHELVAIGNHTTDHGLLPNYTAEGARAQIEGAQDALARLVGHRPRSIAYPAGRYTEETLQIAQAGGLELGITVDYRKNYLPDDVVDGARMRLGRFLPEANGRLRAYLAACRSDVRVDKFVRKLLAPRSR